MVKGTVLVAAEKGFHEVYTALTLKGELLKVLSYKEVPGRLKRSNIDLILLDCDADSKRGLSLLIEMKSVRPDIPVIVLAENCPEIAAMALQAGARKFFCKPFDILELKVAVQNILNIKRVSRDSRSVLPLTDESSRITHERLFTTDKPSSILRAVQYIEERLNEKITLEALAETADLCKFHFCRLFDRHIGMTPMKFVAFMRIERAKELLREQHLPVAKVATYTGFSNLVTFSKQFKKYTGQTATAYQSSLKK